MFAHLNPKPALITNPNHLEVVLLSFLGDSNVWMTIMVLEMQLFLTVAECQ